VLHRLRYQPSGLISYTSSDKWPSRACKHAHTIENEDNIFHDLEVNGRNWHKELPSVLWALRTNVNRAIRDTPFCLVYGVDTVLPLEIFLESAWVVQFGEENQDEAREFDSNLLEEKRNKALPNV
jgi:hypothetical protein